MNSKKSSIKRNSKKSSIKRNSKKSFGISTELKNQLKKINLSPETYLKRAKRAASKTGYNPSLLTFSNDSIHKLNYNGVKFGRVGYGDFIIWTHNEKNGIVPKGYANMKRNVFRTSHGLIKGNWKKNPESKNNLAINILW